MRVAMIGSRGVPAAAGGVEHVVAELARALAGRGHEVLVYARPWYLRGGTGTAAAADMTGVRVITTPGLPGKHTDTITHTATALWDVLRRDVDVVHVHSPGPALLSFVPALAGRRVVLTVHAPDWQRARWSFPARAALRAGLAVGMHAASAVTAVAPHLADYLRRTFGRDVSYIPNGVGERPRRARGGFALAEVGLTEGQYVLCVGRIVPEKRLDLLIDAWGTGRIPLPLAVVGEATGEAGYAAACRKQAPEQVRFLGPQFGEALEVLYDGAAVVAQPSELEGMSLVLLEAATHGCCIVARDIPANREVLGEAMATFADDSPETLANTIIKCMRDVEWRSDLGRRARDRVRGRFCWPKIAAEYERVYCCPRHRRQPTGSPLRS